MNLGVDSTIKFVESSHQYFDADGNEYESVTRALNKLKVPFDRDGISKIMAGSLAKEKGISVKDAQTEILSGWDAKRDSSIDRGLSIHGAIEHFLLTGRRHTDYEKIMDFMSDLVKPYYRFYPEIILYDEKYRRAGQADLVCQRQKIAGSLYDFYDYKTNESKGIQFDSISLKNDEIKHYNRMFLPPFDYMEDCNYNLYCLQLNFYAYFAVRTYGIKVGRLGIIFINNDLEVNLIPVLFSPHLVQQILIHLEKVKKLPEIKANW